MWRPGQEQRTGSNNRVRKLLVAGIGGLAAGAAIGAGIRALHERGHTLPALGRRVAGPVSRLAAGVTGMMPGRRSDDASQVVGVEGSTGGRLSFGPETEPMGAHTTDQIEPTEASGR
jgi:hypothetical protein